MIIGVDFDNTIVNYDELFFKKALEEKIIPESINKSKNGVRDYLKSVGKEDAFTKLQGIIYGPGIIDAMPYPGVVDFFKACKHNSIEVYIISHKTLYPIIGEKHNLHECAKKWLEKYGFFDKKIIGLSQNEVFFELSKKEKINRIIEMKCTHFIDDLPEFLHEKDFPKNVHKILFDPLNKHTGVVDAQSVSSWKEALGKLGLPSYSIQDDAYFSSEKFYELIKSIIINIDKNRPLINEKNKEILKIIPIKGGKNNRVFEIIYNDKEKYLLKSYFHHPNDSRDRLKHEYSFLTFAYKNGIRCVPNPFFADFEERIGLYQFIDGKKIKKEDLNKKCMEKAAEFFIEVNKFKNSEKAKDLPNASESSFSVNKHIATIKKRLEKLNKINNLSEINKEALFFIINDLTKAFSEAQENIRKSLKEFNIDPDEEIENKYRCISPSDFGFHNALIDKNSDIYFIDFEYAGWDDPAKFVCDFFCQPEIPVPKKYFNEFAEIIFKTAPKNESEKGIARTRLLLPLYKIKWCCIILNEFLDTEKARRQFAIIDFEHEAEKKKQLNKAKQYLKNREL